MSTRQKILAGALIVVASLFMLSASSIMAQVPCNGNFDCDQDVDADDVTEFLNHFGRSPFFNPCPPCSPLNPVPKTGQTACYDTNGNARDCAGTEEDGETQRGVERFTDNGDGTITDNFTGLMWLKDGNCIATNYPEFDQDTQNGTVGDGRVTWQHALDFVSGINDGTYPLCGAGHTDWQLPNANEFLSLSPILLQNVPFDNWYFMFGENVEFNLYWSSTSFAFPASPTPPFEAYVSGIATLPESIASPVQPIAKTLNTMVLPVRNPL